MAQRMNPVGWEFYNLRTGSTYRSIGRCERILGSNDRRFNGGLLKWIANRTLIHQPRA